jgi:hypothetical protein
MEFQSGLQQTHNNPHWFFYYNNLGDTNKYNIPNTQ